MELLLDLHIHSKYAYATSKDMDLTSIYKWAKIKGIHVIGTGDCTHPTWEQQLQQQLEPNSYGLFELRAEKAAKIDLSLPHSVQAAPLYFIPTVEISLIYSSDNKVRKIHIVVVLPDLQSVTKLNKSLATKGNLHADGRPTFGMSCEELCEIVYSVTDQAMIIPAHIWTPWFGMFGSKSGVDSIAEAFGKYADKIFAVETGLSSDPAMNWLIPELRPKTIVSFSDAHSPKKLGREATILKCEPSYKAIRAALISNDERVVGTIEFFPQEGKYHLDGHRKCQLSFTPEETALHGGICPVCGRPVTVGVLNRVSALANKDNHFKSGKSVEYIVPLAELIAADKGIKSVTSKTVEKTYFQLIETFGDEFSLLRSLASSKLENAGYGVLANLIAAMRTGEITMEPGYDGEYGTLVLPKTEMQTEQLSLGF